MEKERIEAIWEQLQYLATRRRTTHYEELNEDLNLGLDLKTDLGRGKLATYLDTVSEEEYQNKRPLLSVLVYHKNKKDHGTGFYSLLGRLFNKPPSVFKNNMDKIEQIMKECFEYWHQKDRILSENKEKEEALISHEDVILNRRTDFTTSKLVEYLNNKYGGKASGKPFRIGNLQQYILRGHMPAEYGGHQIYHIEDEYIGYKLVRVRFDLKPVTKKKK